MGIRVPILDPCLRDPGIHRRLGHRAGHAFDQARIEGGGDDVIRPEGRVRAVGRSHFLRHPLSRELGDGFGSGDLHLLVDRGRLDVERAAEDEGEAQHVVDLVGEIRAPGGDDGIGPRSLGFVRHDFRHRVGHGEDDGLVRHLLYPFRLQRPGGGKTEEDVRPDQRFFEAACLGFDGMRALPLIHVVAPRIDRSGPVAHDHVVVGQAHALDKRGAGQRRSARSVHDHPAILQLAPRQVHRVQKTGGRDNRRAVLIVVHDRNVHPLAQGLFDDEAFGRGDVFQVDAAETGFHQGDRLDELVRVFGVEFDIDRIDVGEAFEQHRLALHHRLGRQRAQIAEPENGRPVGDDRHEIGTGGIARRVGRVFGNGFDRGRHARRIGQAEVALGRHRFGRDDLDFPGSDRLVVEQRLARGEPGLLFFGHARLRSFA